MQAGNSQSFSPALLIFGQESGSEIACPFRYIPVSIFEKMLLHAEFCAHVLGVYGLPLLGLHVLSGRAGLMEVEATSKVNGARHVKDLERNLVAALMVRHLPAPKVSTSFKYRTQCKTHSSYQPL